MNIHKRLKNRMKSYAFERWIIKIMCDHEWYMFREMYNLPQQKLIKVSDENQAS